MATLEQKAFCVLQFARHESVVSVQRAFRRQFNSDPPSPNSIRRWYQQFQTTGCHCKRKKRRTAACQKKAWNELDFSSQSDEIVGRASQLQTSSMTLWRVLRKRLHMKPYRFHLLQFLKPTDHNDRSNFCIKMHDAFTEEGFLDRVVFSDESKFHISAVAYPGCCSGGGSTNSVEDRGQRERGSGGGSPLVRGSEGSCNLVQEISFHIVEFY